MIRVQAQTEPQDFNEKIRLPGQKFLQDTIAKNFKPTTEWNKRRGCYWVKAIPDLHIKYKKICAYSSLWLPPAKGTVDHYIPKSKNHTLAYEWKNFCIVSA